MRYERRRRLALALDLKPSPALEGANVKSDVPLGTSDL